MYIRKSAAYSTCAEVLSQHYFGEYSGSPYGVGNVVPRSSTLLLLICSWYFCWVLNFVIFVVRYEISTHELFSVKRSTVRMRMRGFTCVRVDMAVLPRLWRSYRRGSLSHKTRPRNAPWPDVHAYTVRVHLLDLTARMLVHAAMSAKKQGLSVVCWLALHNGTFG